MCMCYACVHTWRCACIQPHAFIWWPARACVAFVRAAREWAAAAGRRALTLARHRRLRLRASQAAGVSRECSRIGLFRRVLTFHYASCLRMRHACQRHGRCAATMGYTLPTAAGPRPCGCKQTREQPSHPPLPCSRQVACGTRARPWRCGPASRRRRGRRHAPSPPPASAAK